MVRSTVVLDSDASATAARIESHEGLYRLGFAAHLVLLLCNLPLAVCFYELLQVVSRTLSLVVAFFILIGTAVESFTLLNNFAALLILKSGYLSAVFTPGQLHSLAYTSLQLEDIGLLVSFAFFGIDCFTTGYLIFRSGFIPRLVGVLQATAGACYLTHSFLTFLTPEFASRLFPYILLPCFVGEGFLTLWLIVKGVNVRIWEERRALSAQP